MSGRSQDSPAAASSRSGSWIALGLVLAAFGSFVLMPSSDGRELLEARRAVLQLLATPELRHPDALIAIEATRYSPAAVAGQALAAWSLSVQHDGSEAAKDEFVQALVAGHNAGAIQAIAPGYIAADDVCLVRASAQALGVDPVVQGLADAAPSRPQLWEYVLLHEAAHCQWDPHTALVQAKAMGELPPEIRLALPKLARHLSEAYADVYAMTMLLQSRGDSALPTISAVVRWRALSNAPNGAHQTTAAIAALEARIKDAPLPATWEATHALVRDSAVDGAKAWLRADGVSATEAEQWIAVLRHTVPAIFTTYPAPPRLAAVPPSP